MTSAPDAGPVRPWLAIALAGPPGQSRLARSPGGVTVIDIAGPHGPPVMVNPLEPGPGYPVQAHADRLAGLFEAAFGLTEPVAAAVRTGLQHSYTDCGWDPRTGRAGPGAPAAPDVPSFAQLRQAIATTAAELGYSEAMRASVAGFLASRLDPLWAGPAGRFLEGGHPADLDRLLTTRVVVANSAVADEQAVSFLAGVLLLRVAELAAAQAQRGRGQADRQRDRTLVLESPAGLEASPGWFGRLLSTLRAAGAEILLPASTDARPAESMLSAGLPPAADSLPPARAALPAAGAPGAQPLLAGRRSAACGQRCQVRPCTGYELHAAAQLSGGDGQAWPRLWVQALVIAFVAGRPLPRVPVHLRRAWAELSPRRQECVLADVIDRLVTLRSAGLRPSYDPGRLMSAVATVAARMLDRPDPVLFRAGQVWVIPPLRWLHEMERVHPYGQDMVRFDDIAPPLDYGLAGLPDWPGIRVRDRIGGLRQHRSSMESQHNRHLAAIALLGEDGGASLYADLATAGTGLGPQLRLRHAARLMGAGGRGHEPGWLEVVLSWPNRIIRPAWESDVRRTATG